MINPISPKLNRAREIEREREQKKANEIQTDKKKTNFKTGFKVVMNKNRRLIVPLLPYPSPGIVTVNPFTHLSEEIQ